MDASEFNIICGVLDEMIDEIKLMDMVMFEDFWETISNDKYRDNFIKHNARKIKEKLESSGRKEDVWDRIRDITNEVDNTENWINMRIWALLGVANCNTKEEAIKKINRGEYLDKIPTYCVREGELVEKDE